MVKSTSTFPSALLNELVSPGHTKSKTETVMHAFNEEIKRRAKGQIKDAAGKMHFSAEADELRHGDHRLG